MGFMVAADPASKVTRAFTDPVELVHAMENYGFIPLRPDGVPFIVNFLTAEGGHVYDGAPSNVWFEGVWYEGQKEIGSKYWGSDGVPTPNNDVLALPVVPMPEPVLRQYLEFKQNQAASGGLFSGNNMLLYAGLGLAALFLFGRNR
jgi:hypothetical protein